jgi:membrane protein required for colicin V production
VLLLVIGFSVLAGFQNGFARAGIGFAATIVGLFAGFWCYGLAGSHVQDYVSSPAMANLIGFLLIFFGVLLLGAVIGRLLAALFKWVGLSWFDRLLGAAFGAVRGLVIAAALVTVLVAFAPSPPPKSLVDSKVMPYVIAASNILAAATPHEIKDAFRDTQDKVKRIWEEHQQHKPPALQKKEARESARWIS